METFEYDHNLFSRQHAGDDSLFVIFYMGTMKNDGANDCRTVCVVSRRSFERCMPPCSAIERKRLITRHSVIQGTNHSST